MNVLLTGATGFVGSELTRELLLRGQCDLLYLLIRPSSDQTAKERFEQLVEHWRKFAAAPSPSQLTCVRIVSYDLCGDAPLPDLGDIDLVYHAAAATDLGQSLRAGRRQNVEATQRLLILAKQSHHLKRFVHFSTAYVSGKRRGLIHEDAPAMAFHNHYESSKKDSEASVIASGLPHTILRPSIIVGRSDNGYVWRPRVLYSVWRLWLSGILPRAPLDPHSWIDLVPIDYVVQATLALALQDKAVYETVHLCAGCNRVSPVTVMKQAAQGFDVPQPRLAPRLVVLLLRKFPTLMTFFVSRSVRDILRTMMFHLPYLGMRGREFSTAKAKGLLQGTGVECPEFNSYGLELFRFCKATGWGKRAAKRPGLALIAS